MGRHRGERRFSLRPEDEPVTREDDFPMVPSRDRLAGRSGPRTRSSKKVREDDEFAPGRDIERRERHRDNPRHDSRRNDRKRSSRRRGKSKRNYILYVIFVAVCLSVAEEFDNIISTSDIITAVEKIQWQSLIWPSKSKKPASFKSKVVAIDEKAELFFQTGQLHGSNQMLRSSMNGQKRVGTSQNIAGNDLLKKNSPLLKNEKSTNEMNGQKGVSSSQNIVGNDLLEKYLPLPKKEKSIKEMEAWPPLSSLVDTNGNIAANANISGLLDFSIVGFPKTATTSLHRHLSDLTMISLPNEHCDLVVNDTVKLVREIYADHTKRLGDSKDGEILENQLRGIKCPQDISSDWSMHNYAKHFPQTKLIVGIRHPIFWFESLYNFRVSNVPWKTMLPTSKLTKGCPSGSQGVCAWRANFHDFLSRLGKTPMTSQSELKLLSLKLKPVQSSVGPVFLYDLSQLGETDFRQDLRDFLGLSKDIPPFPSVDTSGRWDHIAGVESQTAKLKIDICGQEHAAIRSALMEKSQSASIWMRDYFLKSKDVFVSNRPYFEGMLKSWMNDPCG